MPSRLLDAGALLLAAAPAARAQVVGSFYTAVSSNDNLSTLKAAIDAAGLADALSDPTLAYTVFAPTNDVRRPGAGWGMRTCGSL